MFTKAAVASLLNVPLLSPHSQNATDIICALGADALPILLDALEADAGSEAVGWAAALGGLSQYSCGPEEGIGAQRFGDLATALKAALDSERDPNVALRSERTPLYGTDGAGIRAKQQIC